ncbi:hypothetical protein [Chitinophaga sp. sic0106]|uniref:hypothetical protein n=1 Tax=Chitinophaga sp. sic0106 TaxID=2854785 RepID=UPI001C43FB0E|nr:hypothetical protein [Chitinophaga sp. sic0106]MBV7529891.1 hypothetical protein [Chitinophaga sp. sic0106]
MRPIIKTLPANISTDDTIGGQKESNAVHHALIESLGNYCSYCEMPLSGYHVEHLKFHAAWPEQVTFRQWDELLLICNDCRTHIRIPELNDLSAAAMLWPDKDPSFSLFNSPLKYELRKVNYIVENEGEIISQEMKELVFVVAAKDAGEVLYEKAFNTITHFQLNMQLEFYQEAKGELRVPLSVHQQRLDNRMFKRTETWFDALDSINRLKEADQANDGSIPNFAALRKLLVNQIALTAWWAGNWSVWMTVFYQQTNDLELLRTAFAGNTHEFYGLNNDHDALFRAQ